MSDWAAALDRYEAALDGHERAWRSGEPAPCELWPPDELPSGGVPPEHRARAERLLRRSGELMACLQQALDELPKPTALRRHSPARPQRPTWLDASL